MDPFVLRAVRPVPRLGIQVGDRVIFDPDAPALLTRWRAAPIPNIGAALLAYESGALEAPDILSRPSAAELRAVVGLSPPVSGPHAPAAARPSLRVVR